MFSQNNVECDICGLSGKRFCSIDDNIFGEDISRYIFGNENVEFNRESDDKLVFCQDCSLLLLQTASFIGKLHKSLIHASETNQTERVTPDNEQAHDDSENLQTTERCYSNNTLEISIANSESKSVREDATVETTPNPFEIVTLDCRNTQTGEECYSNNMHEVSTANSVSKSIGENAKADGMDSSSKYKLRDGSEDIFYKCNHCPYKTKSKNVFKKHSIYKHNLTSQRTFKCEKCPKAFMRYKSLQLHIHTHESSNKTARKNRKSSNEISANNILSTPRKQLRNATEILNCLESNSDYAEDDVTCDDDDDNEFARINQNQIKNPNSSIVEEQLNNSRSSTQTIPHKTSIKQSLSVCQNESERESESTLNKVSIEPSLSVIENGSENVLELNELTPNRNIIKRSLSFIENLSENEPDLNELLQQILSPIRTISNNNLENESPFEIDIETELIDNNIDATRNTAAIVNMRKDNISTKRWNECDSQLIEADINYDFNNSKVKVKSTPKKKRLEQSYIMDYVIDRNTVNCINSNDPKSNSNVSIFTSQERLSGSEIESNLEKVTSSDTTLLNENPFENEFDLLHVREEKVLMQRNIKCNLPHIDSEDEAPIRKSNEAIPTKDASCSFEMKDSRMNKSFNSTFHTSISERKSALKSNFQCSRCNLATNNSKEFRLHLLNDHMEKSKQRKFDSKKQQLLKQLIPSTQNVTKKQHLGCPNCGTGIKKRKKHRK